MLMEPKCYTRKCRHFVGVKWLGEEESSEVVVCEAFPDGIAHGDNPHTAPFPGDHGIMFELKEA